MIDASARSVELANFPLAIVATILALLPITVVTVSVRIFVRLNDRGLGVDDALLLGGMLVYIANAGLAVHGVTVGIGSKNADMNVWMQSEAQKFYIIWISVYVVAVALIKSSVCFTLMRICSETRRGIRCAIWGLLALTWASFCVTFFGILTFCRPVEANWNVNLIAEGKATCATTQTLIGISHTNTATSIVTDVGCVVLPGILLWELQMSTKAKLQVTVLLSLASVASLTTIARAPFISHYNDPTNNLFYYIGYIVLLSCIELAVGCTASALPSVQRLYKQRFGTKGGHSSGSGGASNQSKTLVTIGGSNLPGAGSSSHHHHKPKSHRARVFTNPSDRGTTTAYVAGGTGEGSWERLHDVESMSAASAVIAEGGGGGGSSRGVKPQPSQGQIQAVYTYSVEMEPVGKRPMAF